MPLSHHPLLLAKFPVICVLLIKFSGEKSSRGPRAVRGIEVSHFIVCDSRLQHPEEPLSIIATLSSWN